MTSAKCGVVRRNGRGVDEAAVKRAELEYSGSQGKKSQSQRSAEKLIMKFD